jgi:hypothetical protein
MRFHAIGFRAVFLPWNRFSSRLVGGGVPALESAPVSHVWMPPSVQEIF